MSLFCFGSWDIFTDTELQVSPPQHSGSGFSYRPGRFSAQGLCTGSSLPRPLFPCLAVSLQTSPLPCVFHHLMCSSMHLASISYLLSVCPPVEQKRTCGHRHAHTEGWPFEDTEKDTPLLDTDRGLSRSQSRDLSSQTSGLRWDCMTKHFWCVSYPKVPVDSVSGEGPFLTDGMFSLYTHQVERRNSPPGSTFYDSINPTHDGGILIM